MVESTLHSLWLLISMIGKKRSFDKYLQANKGKVFGYSDDNVVLECETETAQAYFRSKSQYRSFKS